MNLSIPFLAQLHVPLLSGLNGAALLNEYGFIILASLIIILSYFFNQVAKRTNIPSVILLIATGVILQLVNNRVHLVSMDLFPILAFLGVVGLIMIVLEAALDLDLRKDKISLILKSLGVALICLLGTTALVMLIFEYTIEGMDRSHAILYAIPFAVMSSAIVIPSVGNLSEHKREFMIYESTFSDILGIMLFYFDVEVVKGGRFGEEAVNFATGFGLTVVLAIVVSYLLVILFQSLRSPVKLFVLIAMLMLLYSVGKLLHLSPLFIILVFGIVLANPKLFFRGFLKKAINLRRVHRIESEFTVLTMESAFVVRTFFFVMFGFTLTLSALAGWDVWYVSLLVLAAIYLVRLPVVKLFMWKEPLSPILWLAPRGLITILLLFSIPAEHQVASFNSGILLIVIIVTSLIMTFALIQEGVRTRGLRADAEDAGAGFGLEADLEEDALEELLETHGHTTSKEHFDHERIVGKDEDWGNRSEEKAAPEPPGSRLEAGSESDPSGSDVPESEESDRSGDAADSEDSERSGGSADSEKAPPRDKPTGMPPKKSDNPYYGPQPDH